MVMVHAMTMTMKVLSVLLLPHYAATAHSQSSN
jgi:hypothetical protein